MAPISVLCPSRSVTKGVVCNGKSTAGHQRYLCKQCRMTWQRTFTYTASQPGKYQKIIDMAMNGGWMSCQRSHYQYWFEHHFTAFKKTQAPFSNV